MAGTLVSPRRGRGFAGRSLALWLVPLAACRAPSATPLGADRASAPSVDAGVAGAASASGPGASASGVGVSTPVPDSTRESPPPGRVLRSPSPRPRTSEPPVEESGFKADESSVSLHELAEQKGVKLPARLQMFTRCVARRVGGADGVLCHAGVVHGEPSGFSVLGLSLLVVGPRSIREVFTFPAQARSLAFAEAIYATLRVEYDEEHGLLALTDGSHPCEEATRVTSYGSLEYRRVVNRLCQARGLYDFKGGTFVRRSSPTPLRWPEGQVDR